FEPVMLLANYSVGLTPYCWDRVAGPDRGVMICAACFALVRQFAPVALAAALAFTLIGCKTTQPTETTVGIGAVRGEADWPRTAQVRGVRPPAPPDAPPTRGRYDHAAR